MTQVQSDLEKVKMEHEMKEYELNNQISELKQRLKVQIKEAQDKEMAQQESEYKLTKVQE